MSKIYKKCTNLKINCEWRLQNRSKKGYEYLNNACYLTVGFGIEKPCKKKGNNE